MVSVNAVPHIIHGEELWSVDERTLDNIDPWTQKRHGSVARGAAADAARAVESARVAFDGENRTVIPGPFAQVSELASGFWIWKVKDLDDAIAWVKKCPNPMPGPSEIEIRPLYEMEDFA